MLHLIAYDIANDRRLRRVAAICEDYGCRIEKSVFECDLDDATHGRSWGRLMAAINPDCDSVIDYPIGLLARKRIVTVGVIKRFKEGALIF